MDYHQEPLVRAEGLHKSYGHRQALRGIDLAIWPGETVAIIGPNGAGKSTLLDLLLGLRQPDEGKVHYNLPEPRRQIGLQLQNAPFFAGFTVLENLRMFAACYGLRCKKAELLVLLERCGLREAAHTNAAHLSGGQQKWLAIAIALVHQPRLLFLDEPAAALDPRARREMRSWIAELAGEGGSVVLTSHDMEEVQQVADRILLLHDGRIVAEGTPKTLLSTSGTASLEDMYLKYTDTKEGVRGA